jgi:hypothetical protein
MSARLRLRGAVDFAGRPPAPALLFASAAGWALLVWMTTAGIPTQAMPSGHTMPGIVTAPAMDMSPSAPAFSMWAAMVLAMAPLLLVREIGRLWRGSLRRRRLLTVAVFVSGYGLVWMLVGAVAAPLADLLSAGTGSAWIAVALAALWLCSPARQRCNNVCHRAPTLRVFGWPAQVDALRYGVVTGAACAATCGPIMVLVLLAADFHVLAMAIATVLLTVERYRPARRPRWRLPLTPSAAEWLGVSTGGRAVRGRTFV